MFADYPNLYYAVMIVGTILIALIITLILRKIIAVLIRRSTHVIKTDPTNFSFLKNAIPFVVFSGAIIFIFYKIPYLKSVGAALFAGAGILAAIIGFASQKAFANIVSGIFILMFKPFRVGDTVALSSGQMGIVEEITLRHTVIRNYENRRIIIPNNQISDDVLVNSSIADEKIRKFVEFGISYDADVDKAIRIIQEEANRHPNFIDNRTADEKKTGVPPVIVRMMSHGDFSITLRAYVWAASSDAAFVLYTDMLYSVKKRFDHEGIEIPFPYRTLVFKKDIEETDFKNH